MCATMGYSSVPVVKKLKIGIISTGDELKPPGETSPMAKSTNPIHTVYLDL